MRPGEPNSTPPELSRHYLIGGRVQGVGFRMFAVAEATRLGLRGWARNLPTGQVEVLCAGSPAAMDEFLTLLERGPAMAEVTEFVVSESGPEPFLTAFGERR